MLSLFTLICFDYFSDVKRLKLFGGLWIIVLMIAFFALQLIPALYPSIHKMIYVQQQALMRNVHEESSSLESLKMSKELYQHIQEEGKEISWNGQRYDIKSIQFHDGLVELIVKKDTLETKLKNLVSILEGKQDDSSPINTGSGFMAFFYQAQQAFTLIQPYCPSQILLHSSFELSTRYVTIIAPPPRA